MTPEPARAVTHVGLAVPDIEAAVDWYVDVFSFDVIVEPQTITRGEPFWRGAASLVGEEFESLTIAQLATGNQVGFELFEFDATDGPNDRPASDGGYFHICVIDPDIEGLAAKIDENGGEHYSDILGDPESDRRATYCHDPWGNKIEIYTKSYERYQLTGPDGGE